jgi:hypothetical protein
MTSTWLAAVVAVVAIGLTYFICGRPHLPDRARAIESHSENQAVARQLADLRDELRALRAQHGFAGSPTPPHGPPLSMYTDSS